MICHGISYHGVSYHGIPWYIFIRVLAVVSPYKELSLMSVSNLLFVLISIKKYMKQLIRWIVFDLHGQ